MLSGQPASLHLELLKRIGKWQRQSLTVVRVEVADSVQAIRRSEAQAAGCRYDQPVGETPVSCRIQQDGRASQKDQLGSVASVERQFQDPLVLDELPNADVPRLDRDSVGLYLDRVRHLAHLQYWVDYCTAVDLQDNASLHVSPEPGQSSLQPIRSEHQVRQDIGSGFICESVSPDPGVGLRRRDFHAR